MNLPACPPIRQNILKAIYHIHDQCTKYGHLIACSEKEEIWECGGGSDKQRGGKNLGSLLVNETHHKKKTNNDTMGSKYIHFFSYGLFRGLSFFTSYYTVW